MNDASECWKVTIMITLIIAPSNRWLKRTRRYKVNAMLTAMLSDVLFTAVNDLKLVGIISLKTR